MPVNLSVKPVENAKPAPPGKRVEIADGAIAGLRLRTIDTGAKSFVLLRTLPDGSRRRSTFGAFDSKAKDGAPGGLSHVRDRAREYVATLRDGRDPEAKLEAEMDARRIIERVRRERNTVSAPGLWDDDATLKTNRDAVAQYKADIDLIELKIVGISRAIDDALKQQEIERDVERADRSRRIFEEQAADQDGSFGRSKTATYTRGPSASVR